MHTPHWAFSQSLVDFSGISQTASVTMSWADEWKQKKSWQYLIKTCSFCVFLFDWDMFLLCVLIWLRHVLLVFLGCWKWRKWGSPFNCMLVRCFYPHNSITLQAAFSSRHTWSACKSITSLSAPPKWETGKFMTTILLIPSMNPKMSPNSSAGCKNLVYHENLYRNCTRNDYLCW